MGDRRAIGSSMATRRTQTRRNGRKTSRNKSSAPAAYCSSPNIVKETNKPTKLIESDTNKKLCRATRVPIRCLAQEGGTRNPSAFAIAFYYYYFFVFFPLHSEVGRKTRVSSKRTNFAALSALTLLYRCWSCFLPGKVETLCRTMANEKNTLSRKTVCSFFFQKLRPYT